MENYKNMRVFKAIIYDLDNTIFPASGINRDVARPVLDAIENANEGFLTKEVLEEVFLDCYRLSIRDVAHKYQFNDKMVNAAYDAFSKLQLDYNLEPYPDYELIRTISGMRFLVTSGYHSFQSLKIDNLKIRQDFQEIFIHDNDKSSFEGKIEIFKGILQQYGLNSDEVLVIGDNPHSEIAAGNFLNISTVQILREGVVKSNDADFYINDFSELCGFFEDKC